MRTYRSLVAALAGVFVATLSTVHLLAQTATTSATASAAPAFVGSATCATCHQREHAAWQGSQHAHAMAHARGAAVLGDFNDATFVKDAVVTTFTHRDGLSLPKMLSRQF
jgi:hypothetical protein